MRPHSSLYVCISLIAAIKFTYLIIIFTQNAILSDRYLEWLPKWNPYSEILKNQPSFTEDIDYVHTQLVP